MVSKIKVFNTGSHCNELNTKFFCSIKANKKEKQVTPMSSKNMIQRGTIFIFFNMFTLFDGDIQMGVLNNLKIFFK